MNNTKPIEEFIADATGLYSVRMPQYLHDAYIKACKDFAAQWQAEQKQEIDDLIKANKILLDMLVEQKQLSDEEHLPEGFAEGANWVVRMQRKLQLSDEEIEALAEKEIQMPKNATLGVSNKIYLKRRSFIKGYKKALNDNTKQ